MSSLFSEQYTLLESISPCLKEQDRLETNSSENEIEWLKAIVQSQRIDVLGFRSSLMKVLTF